MTLPRQRLRRRRRRGCGMKLDESEKLIEASTPCPLLTTKGMFYLSSLEVDFFNASIELMPKLLKVAQIVKEHIKCEDYFDSDSLSTAEMRLAMDELEQL